MRTAFEDGNYPTFYRGVGLICSSALILTDLNQECLSLVWLYAKVQRDGGGRNVERQKKRPEFKGGKKESRN